MEILHWWNLSGVYLNGEAAHTHVQEVNSSILVLLTASFKMKIGSNIIVTANYAK